MNRRVLLRGIGAAGATGLLCAVAGCTSSSGDGNGAGGGNSGTDGNASSKISTEGTASDEETTKNGSTDTGEHAHGGNHQHGRGMGRVPDGPSEHADVAMLDTNGGRQHHFDPHVVWVKKGGTVTWTLESGVHSTTAYHPDNDKPLRIPKGAKPWNSEILTTQGQTFEHTFAVEGVYDYFCIPHESMGMIGSVIVGTPKPTGQPALEPPQASLPEQAQAKITELNATVTEALSTISPNTDPASEETAAEGTATDEETTGEDTPPGYNY